MEADETEEGRSAPSNADSVRTQVQELWIQYANSMLQFTRSKIPSDADAEDAVTRVFENTYRALLSGGGPSSNPRSYLFSAMRHEISREQYRRDQQTYLEEIPSIRDGLASANEDPGDKSGLLREVLLEFSESDRRLLYEVLGEGAKLRDIALELGISPPTASRRLYKIRPRLKARWTQRHIDLFEAPDSCLPSLTQAGEVLAGIAGKRTETSFWNHVNSCQWCPDRIARGSREARAIALLIAPIGLVPPMFGAITAEPANASEPRTNDGHIRRIPRHPFIWATAVGVLLCSVAFVIALLVLGPKQGSDRVSGRPPATSNLKTDHPPGNDQFPAEQQLCSWSASTLCQGGG